MEQPRLPQSADAARVGGMLFLQSRGASLPFAPSLTARDATCGFLSRKVSIWPLVAVLLIWRSALRNLCSSASLTFDMPFFVRNAIVFLLKIVSAWDVGIDSLDGVVLNGLRCCCYQEWHSWQWVLPRFCGHVTRCMNKSAMMWVLLSLRMKDKTGDG